MSGCYKSRKQLINETIVKTTPEKIDNDVLGLCDRFECMRNYFDDDAWTDSVNSIECKRSQLTCKSCDRIILEKASQCSSCHKRYHADCEGLKEDNLLKKKWKCKACVM